jgi:hypothetical protein
MSQDEHILLTLEPVDFERERGNAPAILVIPIAAWLAVDVKKGPGKPGRLPLILMIDGDHGEVMLCW